MLKTNERAFQRRKVAALKKRPFAELAALPQKMALRTPPSFKGLSAFVRREPGERGGVEITVSIGYAGMEFGEGFEMLPSGKVLALGGTMPEPHRRAKTPRAGRGRDRHGLPRGIKSQVLRYLHLEYGESPRNRDALKLSDLSYEGAYERDGVPTHFWSYPTSSGKAYATVVVSGNSYAIGTTDDRPGEQPRRRGKK